MSASIALAEAKAHLSSVIRRVDETGAEFVVTVRNRPCAMIVPVPKPAPRKLKAAGALAGKRPTASRETEKAAYREALEAKYVDLP
ncbi:type II toxin-antitoxin system prevent-host-death family antitoxin [Adlercreutzia sp. R21]|uniref:Antitoxin n=1 Tax=Adlercreutzia wanghongyangiae TaxID=3111451 RepID=A0ABU6IEK8_9ACTN|nr:type II toxin-antitoxin system prevent-host-death family antitoxin [Adlercreutzia sp. R21]MEC4174870.1 type II toxin-antitoxin system prevent-host-death family antitoxin [Adlercreutzia sp. R7]MEC4185161.1 type II toxin-antitoxin system prevent-host-death family antitoxin [Adlercreutzia sp. R21]